MIIELIFKFEMMVLDVVEVFDILNVVLIKKLMGLGMMIFVN